MRITIDLPDELMRTVKKRAADEGITLRDVFDRAVHHYLASGAPQKAFKLRWTVHLRGKLMPGVVLEARDSLYDLMEGHRP